MKKTFSILLIFAVLLSLFSGLQISSSAADFPVLNGYKPIATKQQFYDIRNTPSGKYYLADDIIFEKSDFISHGAYYNDGYLFKSIATFSGELDGCGHTISGLEGNNVIATDNAGTIKNLRIINSTLSSGAVCTHNYGTVENCQIQTVSALGLVSYNESGGIINYCLSSDSDCGIVSNFNCGEINFCINSSNLEKANSCGIADNDQGTIYGCINYGNINGCGITERYAFYSLAVYNCTNYGNTTLGAIGNCDAYDCINYGRNHGDGYGYDCFATNCVNIGSIKNGKSKAFPLTAIDCYVLENSATDANVLQKDIANPSAYPRLDFKNTWQIKDGRPSLQCNNQKTIGISIYQTPKKTTYQLGEAFDKSGLLVMAYDNLGNWKIVNDYQINGLPLHAGNNKLTIAYAGVDTTLSITVKQDISHFSAGLATSSFVANGSAMKPTVKLIDTKGNILTYGKDYTLKYSNNIYPGKATVQIVGMGNYYGSITKAFIIKPAQIKGLQLSAKSTNALKFTWTKQGGVNGYYVQFYNPKYKKWVKYKWITTNTNVLLATKLNTAATYYFRVCSYRIINGKYYYGAFTAVKGATTLPTVAVVKMGNKVDHVRQKAWHVIAWKQPAGTFTGYQVQYGMPEGFITGFPAQWFGVKAVNGKSKTVYYLPTPYASSDDVGMARVRTYYIKGGKIYYGAWSAIAYAPLNW